jgi:hypothetical protein
VDRFEIKLPGMSLKTRTILIHITGCLFFLALPFIFFPGFEFSTNMFFDINLWREFTAFVLMLLVFYLNYFFLIPDLFFKKKYLYFIILMVACFIIVITIPKAIFPMDHEHDHHMGHEHHHHMEHREFAGDRDMERMPPPPPGFPPGNNFLRGIDRRLFMFLLAVFVSLTLRINMRLKQTQKEKLHVELSYLKAQINPHFLFNSLNSIYSLAIDRSDKTADAVVRLSGMMRYVLSEASREFVSLEKELDYINDYIQLQKLRLGDTIKLEYEVSGNPQNCHIAPLVLIPFVENAFKYGVNAEEDSDIHIHIAIFESNLRLVVKNNKVSTNIEQTVKSGVGIENTKTRLALLYPGRYNLEINETQHSFDVTLQLDLS